MESLRCEARLAFREQRCPNMTGSMILNRADFSSTTPTRILEPVRVNSPVIEADEVIQPIDIPLSEIISENINEQNPVITQDRAPRFPYGRTRSFTDKQHKIIPPSLELNTTGRFHGKTLNTGEKVPSKSATAAKLELKNIDVESKRAIEAEKREFEKILSETIDRHRTELEKVGGDVGTAELLELKEIQFGETIKAAAIDSKRKSQDFSCRKERQMLIDRHKIEIIGLNDNFKTRVEKIRAEYEEKMRPLQDEIFSMMATENVGAIKVYRTFGPLSAEPRYGVNPFSGSLSFQRRRTEIIEKKAPVFRLLKKKELEGMAPN